MGPRAFPGRGLLIEIVKGVWDQMNIAHSFDNWLVRLFLLRGISNQVNNLAFFRTDLLVLRFSFSRVLDLVAS